MKRRIFLKTSTLAGLVVCSNPVFPFYLADISYKELIGQGNPKLFGDGYKLREEANKSFLDMKKKALEDGINIQIVSSYRDFYHQKRIWTRKYNSFTENGLKPTDAINKIIEYSTIPGTSRHHWGTDIDIIDGKPRQPKNVLNEEHFHGNGPYCKLKEWMEEYSESFGYYLVYNNNANRKGFKYEPWHYSYKPLSKEYLVEYQKIDIVQILESEKIVGYNHFSDEFMNSYIANNILDINPELLP